MRLGRYLLYAVAAVQAFFALGFFQQWPLATGPWPFDGTTPLTFIFISSILAAAAASTFWVAATENYGALAGIGLDYVTIMTPLAVLGFTLGTSSVGIPLTIFGLACLFGALFGAGLLLWGLRSPLDARIPMPGPVRWAFVIFVAALLLVGGRLVLGFETTIPWMITAELGTVMGWMFLGAGAYFTYALLRPSWVNSAGQLLGFLAYDLVLIVPFIQRLPNTPPEQFVGQLVYTAVVVFSGLLAGYYLFVHPPTRIWRTG
ncbi:MAG: hypothetical protein ACLFWD_05025 [Anaerolineales bacterium]